MLSDEIAARLEPGHLGPLSALVWQVILVVIAVVDRAVGENGFPQIHRHISSSVILKFVLVHRIGGQTLDLNGDTFIAESWLRHDDRGWSPQWSKEDLAVYNPGLARNVYNDRRH